MKTIQLKVLLRWDFHENFEISQKPSSLSSLRQRSQKLSSKWKSLSWTYEKSYKQFWFLSRTFLKAFEQQKLPTRMANPSGNFFGILSPGKGKKRVWKKFQQIFHIFESFCKFEKQLLSFKWYSKYYYPSGSSFLANQIIQFHCKSIPRLPWLTGSFSLLTKKV